MAQDITCAEKRVKNIQICIVSDDHEGIAWLAYQLRIKHTAVFAHTWDSARVVDLKAYAWTIFDLSGPYHTLAEIEEKLTPYPWQKGTTVVRSSMRGDLYGPRGDLHLISPRALATVYLDLMTRVRA